MRFEYSADAVEDLIRVREFIAEHDPRAAERVSKQLIQGIERLTDQPLLGRPVRLAPDPRSIRDLVLGDYIVRYMPAENRIRILILRIWHHRENWKRR
jgi:plasmid stabilization system protein ParE